MDWKIDMPAPDIGENMVQCSFCNNSQVPDDRAFANAEKKVFICHDCVRMGASLVGDQERAGEPHEPGEPGELDNPRTCSFCGRQEEFAEQIVSAGDKTLYICTACLSDFSARIPPV